MNQWWPGVFSQQLDLEENCQVTKWKTEDNVENGEKYVGISETPYQNLMLDKWVIRIKEKLARHILFLPQEVVRCETWIDGLQRKHNYKRQSP
jgi:hypothetical protein